MSDLRQRPADERRASVEVRNKKGLHLRAAKQLVETLQQFDAEVTLCKDDHRANGSSIMGVLMLAAEQGSAVEVVASGPQAGEALAAVQALFAAGFSETDDDEAP